MTPTPPSIVRKIQSRGHFRVNFRPTHIRPGRYTIAECHDLVLEKKVSLRGWDYPHFPSKKNAENTGHQPGSSYYEGWVDWAQYKEFWRMYQSGQFVHYASLREDWPEDSLWKSARDIKPGTELNVVGSMFYSLGEVFAFYRRMTQDGPCASGAVVAISLRNTAHRVLRMDDGIERAPLASEYRCSLPSIDFSATIAPHDDVAVIATGAATHFAHRFGWLRVSPDIIRELVVDYMNFGYRR